MNWFKRDAKTGSGSIPAPVLRPATQRVVADSVVMPEAGTGLTLVATQERQKIITILSDFPDRDDVMSGVVASTPALQVPLEIQDYVMVVRLNATNAVLAYDPAYTALVKAYFASLRGAVIAQGLRVDSAPLLADSSILRSVRLAAETKRSNGSLTGAASSDGAKLFREWVKRANELGATDVHMSIISGGKGLVQCRVDGELDPIDFSNNGIFTDRDVLNAMRAAYEDMAEKHSNNEGTFTADKPRSCMIAGQLGIPNIRLRFSSDKGFFGAKSVSRILHSELNLPPMSFTDMGLASSQIDLIQKAQRLKSGAVIQVGVTGSGKTTVAKTFIETHPLNGKGAFYGIADPIEYLLKNTHQIYIQRDLMSLETKGKKDPYSETIEQLMRMDPDLIDVGEVRDQLSARALANVAKTGHLAMGTLHAPSIAEVINRLIDPKMGFTRQELTSGKLLSFISYKSLLPVLCKCATDIATARDYHRANNQQHDERYLGQLIQTIEKKYGASANVFKFKNLEGCSLCNGRGTKGLTMVAEMMMPDDKWLDIAAQGNDRAAVRYWRSTYSDKRFDSPNMDGKLIAEHALYKAILGRIDPRHIETWGPLDQMETV